MKELKGSPFRFNSVFHAGLTENGAIFKLRQWDKVSYFQSGFSQNSTLSSYVRSNSSLEKGTDMKLSMDIEDTMI